MTSSGVFDILDELINRNRLHSQYMYSRQYNIVADLINLMLLERSLKDFVVLKIFVLLSCIEFQSLYGYVA